MYSIVIQLGAILCLPVYFRSRIAQFLSTFPRGENGDRTILTHPLSLVLIAFVVTAIPSYLLTKTIGKHLESMTIIGWSLLIGGIFMWIVDAAKAKWEAAGPGRARQHHSYLEDGRDEHGTGSLDWLLPDFFRSVSWDITLDVHHCRRSASRDVASFGAGIFVFPFHSHHDGRDRLHPAQIAWRERARIPSVSRRSLPINGCSC